MLGNLLLVSLGLLLWLPPAHALVLSTPENISIQAQHLPATDDNRSFSQVQKLPQSAWKTADTGLLNLSLDHREHWFKVTIHNQKKAAQQLILLIDQPLQDFIDLWLTRDGEKVKSYQLGDHRPFSNRDDSYRGFSIPLNLPEQESLEVYLRLDTLDGLHEVTPIFLLEPDEYHQRIINDSLWYGFYYGALLILISYNLIIGIMTRERDFFLYSLYLSGFMAWNLVFRGYGNQVFPDNSWISNQGLVIFSCLLLVGLYFFSGSFLRFKSIPPRLYRAIQLLTLYQLAPVCLALTGEYSLAFLVFFPGASALMLTVLGTAAFLAFRGDRSARIFVLAWVILLIATVVYFAQVIGLIPANIFTINSINIGSLIEMLVLALALVDKINQLKQEQANTLQTNLQLQQKNNIELEHLVAEKTAQLMALNKKLEHDSITDALTGLFNRRRLPALFDNKVQSCNEDNETVAFVLLDIDHFKQVNDRFGHQDGDNVLALLAEKMREFWRDTNADLFRFGGEEFGIIVCHTEKEALKAQIRQFHRMIAEKKLHPGCDITISIGAILLTGTSVVDGQAAVDLDTAIAEADALLYDAKNSGRNLCRIKDLSQPAD